MLREREEHLGGRPIGEMLELARLEPKAAAARAGLDFYALDRGESQGLSLANWAVSRAQSSLPEFDLSSAVRSALDYNMPGGIEA
jgi:hypothetical protein